MRVSIRTRARWAARLGALLVAGAAVAASVPAQTASQSFDIVPVADGVYAAIGKNGVYGNGAFIVNQDSVVVVDTQLRPIWAQDLITEIRKITNKPVRYVVNTHWHGDHTLGNQAYVAAFGPNVDFIGQNNMREDLISKGIPSLQQQTAQAVPGNIARLEKQLADGKDAQGNPLAADARTRLEAQISSQKAYLAELVQTHIVPPTITYENEMTIQSPGREIRLYHFSYAHTRGDTVVYLPKEKVIITGDLLTNGIPNTHSSYPVEWITTLEGMDKLDWAAAIPGHGDVQQGKTQLETLMAYWKDVVAGVRGAVAKGVTLDEAKKTLDFSKYRASLPNYDGSNAQAIERAWMEVTGKPME